MTQPVIESIDSLAHLPIFSSANAVSDCPRLYRYNLVYGFNGSGKTTLSRLFSCLGTGKCHEDWRLGATFTVTLTDGTKIKPETVDTDLAQRTLVFNEDFISANFRWREGQANPMVYLGGQADLSTQVDYKSKRLEVINGRLRRVQTIRDTTIRAFKQHKTDHARLIATELQLGRQYVATHLESDYASYSYASSDVLDDESLDAQKATLKQDDAPELLDTVSEDSPSLAPLIKDTRGILQTTLGKLAVKSIQEHHEKLPWIRDGLEYHKAHKLESCLFCGSPLTGERVSLLEATIDDQYEKLVGSISSTIETASELRRSLSEVLATLPAIRVVIKDQQKAYKDAAQAIRSSILTITGHLDVILELLSAKKTSPNSPIATDGLLTESQLEAVLSEYARAAVDYNVIVGNQNQVHFKFESFQEIARQKIKNHYLAEGWAIFRQQESKSKKASALHSSLEVCRDKLNAEIGHLKTQMRQHGLAADHINKAIHNYLGHAELSISVKEEGYEIKRSGKIADAPPSEGEKTALALSYFLVLLEADGRKRKDLIVVVDDPVSSLDTRALNYACSLIRSLNNVAQLIVLTHNVHAMNELKKWLKGKTEKAMEKSGRGKEEATSSLLFIETRQTGDEPRRSRIVELPKHLREYESEYHYLFHLILRFQSNQVDSADFFFLMPNVLRKVMEIFLAFKRPSSSGLRDKVADIARETGSLGIDQTRILALERLAQVESHGDNIEDLISNSSMTIEETELAAEALIELMNKVDEPHTSRMKNLCRA